jgi:uncharacterized membrane protein (DUF373 family)
MQQRVPMGKTIAVFESGVIFLLQVLLIVVLAVALLELFLRFGQVVIDRYGVTQAPALVDLQRDLQHAFAGVLLIILGLELLDTLKVYFNEHRVRLEVILIVAIIAVGRHIIQLDFEHAEAGVMLGIAALVLALAAGYFLICRLGVITSNPFSTQDPSRPPS